LAVAAVVLFGEEGEVRTRVGVGVQLGGVEVVLSLFEFIVQRLQGIVFINKLFRLFIQIIILLLTFLVPLQFSLNLILDDAIRPLRVINRHPIFMLSAVGVIPLIIQKMVILLSRPQRDIGILLRVYAF
jgi:hypothetical protein